MLNSEVKLVEVKMSNHILSNEGKSSQELDTEELIDLSNQNKVYTLQVRFGSVPASDNLTAEILQAIEEGSVLVIGVTDELESALSLRRLPRVPTKSLISDIRNDTHFFNRKISDITVESEASSGTDEDEDFNTEE